MHFGPVRLPRMYGGVKSHVFKNVLMQELPLEPCLSIAYSVLTETSFHLWLLQPGVYGCVEILSSLKVNLLTQMPSIMKQLYPLKSSKDAI
jgi:hypothetical protein